MFLHALATAVPSATYTQPDCWDIVQKSQMRARLKRRSMLILHSILKSDHGIATRHFAMPEPGRGFDMTSDELNHGFRREAPKLAGTALVAALAKAGIEPAELDALLICTCTGYLCPGLTSYVAEELGLAPNAVLHDLVGLGCGAAIPMLRAASHLLAARPEAKVACVAIEVCSAAFYLDDDPGVIISACLFSDGAAATVWRSTPGPSGMRAFDFRSLHIPASALKPPKMTECGAPRRAHASSATGSSGTSCTARSRSWPPAQSGASGASAARGRLRGWSPIPAAATSWRPSRPWWRRIPLRPASARSTTTAT